ncbi:MAG: rod-binding protein [Proteobacteria bacterium]|nr:rod-binding protein [Pseudomonadota bacterium]MBU1709409.1 rod-binding protein [Pseudomonadota bacterium]
MNLSETGLITLKQTPVSADIIKEKKLRKACADFEAIILKQMLATMRKSIPKSGLVDTSYAQEMYQSLHDDGLAEKMAHTKGMGFGEILFQQLTGKIKPTAAK